MRSRHTRARRAGAMLCALAMAASLTPARVFAEPVPQEESGYTAPAEGPAAAETQPAAETNPAGPGAEEPAAEEKIPDAVDADGGEDAILPPEEGEAAPDTAAVTPAAPEEVPEATPADGSEGAPAADAVEKSTPDTAMKPALLAAKGAGEAPDPSGPAAHAGDEEFSSYTVDGISPSGTTIDLFDYWLADGENGRFAPDNTNPGDPNDPDNQDAFLNLGINAGQVLKFGHDVGRNPNVSGVNWWTGTAKPCFDAVERKLGENGYPLLTLNENAKPTPATEDNQSLAYLFDPDDKTME